MMVKAYMIVIKNHRLSESTALKCMDIWKKHTSIPVEVFDAVTPPTVNAEYKSLGLYWNPVGHHSTINLPEGSLSSARKDNLSKASCAMSHIKLWNYSAITNSDIIILEHDAIMVRDLLDSDVNMIKKSPYGIVSLGEVMPRKRTNFLFEGNNIDTNFPELEHTRCLSNGGAGYYVKSWAAKKLMEKLFDIGYMPCNNDTFISTWFGFDFLACPSTNRWISHLDVSTSGNWENGK